MLGITFTIAAQTTLGALLLGYPLAHWLARLPEGGGAGSSCW